MANTVQTDDIVQNNTKLTDNQTYNGEQAAKIMLVVALATAAVVSIMYVHS